MASTTSKLLTFDEYLQIPDPPGGRYELYHGELANVPFPVNAHVRAQWQLRRLLDRAAGSAGVVGTELPYRPLPEYECWGADVAYLTKERWDKIDRYLFGAPELVIEVLSPSNSLPKLHDKRKICLENGAREFWIVDPVKHEVEVSTPDGHSIIYKSGQQIALFFAPGATLAVDSIFE